MGGAASLPPRCPPPQHRHRVTWKPATTSCPTTRGGWLSLHWDKATEAAGLSSPGHATCVGLPRKTQSSENPQFWPINRPVASKTRQGSLMPYLAYLAKSTHTTAYC